MGSGRLFFTNLVFWVRQRQMVLTRIVSSNIIIHLFIFEGEKILLSFRTSRNSTQSRERRFEVTFLLLYRSNANTTEACEHSRINIIMPLASRQ